ncbi:hypothetical protein EDB85DRAFT_1101977 [Lactarius pseudohatsudake]|nr:hypothetical protein EDB85DRAFT_1101977 [Lactarius pseudohatsudake]
MYKPCSGRHQCNMVFSSRHRLRSTEDHNVWDGLSTTNIHCFFALTSLDCRKSATQPPMNFWSNVLSLPRSCHCGHTPRCCQWGVLTLDSPFVRGGSSPESQNHVRIRIMGFRASHSRKGAVRFTVSRGVGDREGRGGAEMDDERTLDESQVWSVELEVPAARAKAHKYDASITAQRTQRKVTMI